MSRLADIKALLPQVMADRYQPAYWLRVANLILSEIETKVESPEFYAEVPLLLRAGATGYRLPSDVRKPSFLRAPTPGTSQIHRDSPKITFRVVGDLLRLDAPYPPSGLDDLAGAATGGGEDAVVSTAFSGLDADVLRGRMLRLTRAGRHQYRILTGNDGSTVFVNDPFEWEPEAGDAVLVTADYLVLTGLKKLRRFETLSDASPLPDEWDHVLLKGLRFYLEIQTDETSQQAPFWHEQYAAALREFQDDSSTHRGDLYAAKPRKMSL